MRTIGTYEEIKQRADLSDQEMSFCLGYLKRKGIIEIVKT